MTLEEAKALAVLIADREEIQYGWYFAEQDWQNFMTGNGKGRN